MPDETNPFFATAAVNTLTARDMTKLALIFRCAHIDSDVWTGCRVERALSDYDSAGLSVYLSGVHFADHVAYYNDEFVSLDTLKAHAEAYLKGAHNG